MQKNHTSFRSVFSWCLYDWAHSAFSTVIISFIFGTYFIRSVADSTVKGTAHWGWTLGMAGVVVAIFSPIIGSIADYTGKRKPWLGFFTAITIICTALLFYTKPNLSWAIWALFFVALANIGYELAQLFYNAMMTAIVKPEKFGRISGWGWGLGYAGGLTCLAIALFAFIKGNLVTTENCLNVRAVTLLTAAWFLVFCIPIFIFTPDVAEEKMSHIEACKRGFKELNHTLREIKKYKGIFVYLLARLFYIDGLNTLFIFGGIFAAGTFDMSYLQILYFAIILNITAGIGAALFAWVDDWLGPKLTICISLVALIITGFIIICTTNVALFWVVAAILGIFVGPTQAASRSYMAHVAPKHLVNQMFGIYQLSGRITSFIGPFLVSTFTEIFKSQRVGMSTIFFMMIIGFFILLKAPKVKGSSS